MAGREVVRRHLELARAELLQQRDDLDVEIKELDNMLSRYGTEAAQVPLPAEEPGPKPPSRTVPVSLNDAIVDFVTRIVSTNDVVKALEGPGRKPASIRSALPKLADNGKITRPQRGYYGPATTPGDTAGTVSPGSVSTERPGGDGHAAGPDSVPDHDQASGGRDDRDRYRETAPVAVDF